MARLSRIVVPDLPHHVTQRGNRRQPLFVEPGDYALYRDLMAERCRANAVACWAYCLMPNHVHLILVPAAADGLAKAVGEAHRRFTAFANARARVTGHLFQGRFSSRAMDEEHLIAAARYLALNPVRAGLVANPADWPASSVPAHLAEHDDALAMVAPLLSRVPRSATRGFWRRLKPSSAAGCAPPSAGENRGRERRRRAIWRHDRIRKRRRRGGRRDGGRAAMRAFRSDGGAFGSRVWAESAIDLMEAKASATATPSRSEARRCGAAGRAGRGAPDWNGVQAQVSAFGDLIWRPVWTALMVRPLGSSPQSPYRARFSADATAGFRALSVGSHHPVGALDCVSPRGETPLSIALFRRRSAARRIGRRASGSRRRCARPCWPAPPPSA